MRVIGGITDANGSRCFYIMDDNLKLFENPDFGGCKSIIRREKQSMVCW